MFLIDIPFKGCQGRSNRSSIVDAVSILHAVSMHFKKFEYLREFEFIFEKAQDGCFDEKKPSVENLVALSF
jgi:hypothetical protein